MKYLGIVLFCFIASANAEVYRWHDQQGRVIYSDEYHPDAEIIDTPTNASTYAPVAIPTISDDGDNTGPEDEAFVPNYNVKIISPKDNESVRGNNGSLSVSIDINPALDLERGDKFIVLVDGQQQGEASDTTSFILSNINRGTHSLVVSVVDVDGNPLKLSAPISFHLQRHSVQ